MDGIALLMAEGYAPNEAADLALTHALGECANRWCPLCLEETYGPGGPLSSPEPEAPAPDESGSRLKLKIEIPLPSDD